MAMNDRAFERLERHRDAVRGWVLNPLVWKWYIDNWAWHPYPTSLPTGVARGLDVAVRQALSEGLSARYARHARAARAVLAAAAAIGFERFAEREEDASPTVTSLIPPAGADEAALRDSVLHDSGIWIAGGFGALRGRIIRIGHMGEGARRHAVLATIGALENALRAQGMKIDDAAGVQAAARELD